MASWDIALLVVAGYLAVVTLVKLMIRRRDRAVVKLRQVMKRELARAQAERSKQGQTGRRGEAA